MRSGPVLLLAVCSLLVINCEELLAQASVTIRPISPEESKARRPATAPDGTPYLRMTERARDQNGDGTRALLRVVSPSVCIVSFEATKGDGSEEHQQGTATLVNSDGTFLTAKHVVPPGEYTDETLTVNCPFSKYDFRAKSGGGDLSAHRIRYSTKYDLRLIKVDEVPSDLVSASVSERDPAISSNVTIVGYYPRDTRPYPLVRKLQIEQLDDNGILYTSGSILRGMSGAPLFDNLGRVIGLYSRRRDMDDAGAPNIGEVVGATQISQFLEAAQEFKDPPLVARGEELVDRLMLREGKLDAVLTVYQDAGVCKDTFRTYSYPC